MSFHGSHFATSSIRGVQLHEIPRTKFLDAMLNHSPVRFTLHFGPKFFLNASIASEAFDSSYQLKRPLMACNFYGIGLQKCFRNSKHLLRFFFSISLVALSSLGDRAGFGVGDAAGVGVPLLRLSRSLFSHISVCNTKTRSSVPSAPPCAGRSSSLRVTSFVGWLMSQGWSISFASFTKADIVSLSCFGSLSHVTACSWHCSFLSRVLGSLSLVVCFFLGSWVPGPWLFSFLFNSQLVDVYEVFNADPRVMRYFRRYHHSYFLLFIHSSWSTLRMKWALFLGLVPLLLFVVFATFSLFVLCTFKGSCSSIFRCC